MKKKDFTLKPGEKLSQEILDKLRKVNDTYSKTKHFPQYLREIETLFPVEEPQITTETKLFLGGFLEGEASLSVSAKKLYTAKFGIMIDPEFNITQHVNGFSTLYLALKIFQTGRISYKSGSNATLVFRIDNRQTLEQKVIPFFEQYVVPYGSPEKRRQLKRFKTILELFNQYKHHDLNSFLNEILPIWDEMRKQKGQVNESFPSLEAAREYARQQYNLKNKTE